ncbi:MAG: T9SS type A sorting domain-containing protein, partial [Polaribacter sp.]|nr:T9SS type A sorting domain-containing protein [Polaribacter sp.]
GVIAAADKELTFTAEIMNFPTDLKVYLEDRDNNTFTRIDEANTEYKITVSNTLNGIGRFYLHTSQKVLSAAPNFVAEHVSIYKTNSSTLRIVGLSQEKASVKLFNILGKEVLNTSFTFNGLKDVALPRLAKGVYVVQLTTEAFKVNKKIILE